MTVPEKSKRKSKKLVVTLDSSPVTPAGYLQLLRVSYAYSVAGKMPFRVAGLAEKHLLWMQRPLARSWRRPCPSGLLEDEENRKVANFFGHCYEKCQG